MLSSFFESEDDINDLTKRFLKKVDGCISRNFNKTRITTKTDDKIQELYDKMRSLKEKNDNESVD
jgi:hypothetical protein